MSMDVFADGEMFEATEKLHGTQTRFIFSKGVVHEETFGANKDIYIASKGQGDKLTSENFLNTFLSNGVSGYRLRENYGGIEIFYTRKRNNNISHVIYFHNKTEEFILR